MANVRAKFRCDSIKTFGAPAPGITNDSRVYRFGAVHDDGTPENQRYARYTPIGSLEIQVDNPNVSFEPGKDYYLDFTPVDAE